MNRTNFPQNGLSVESTVVVKAEYHADSHSVKVTINGSPFESASSVTREANAARAVDILMELESTLIHMYNADSEEVERLIGAARDKLVSKRGRPQN